MPERIGLIAGNGSFPLLVLDAALAQGLDVVVAAIKEEASPEIEKHGATAVHWLSLGELSRLIETLQREGVHRAVMEFVNEARWKLRFFAYEVSGLYDVAIQRPDAEWQMPQSN